MIRQAVLEVSVTQNQDPPNQFSIRLAGDALSSPCKHPFLEGAKVEIGMGYQNRVERIFVGEITALSMEFPSSGEVTLQVEGFDPAHRLTRGTAYRIFGAPGPEDALSDSDIVTRIAQEVGMRVDVDATPKRKKARVQQHTTNRTLLNEIVEANNYFLWVEDGTLYFKRRPLTARTVALEWHKDLLSFSPRLTTASQVEAVIVRGWDPQQKQAFVSRASRSPGISNFLSEDGFRMIAQGADGKSARVLTDTTVASKEEAQRLADRVLHAQEQEFLTGSGAAVGNANIRVGTKLKLTKIERFSATYTVTKATHTYGGEGYQTQFEVSYGG